MPFRRFPRAGSIALLVTCALACEKSEDSTSSSAESRTAPANTAPGNTRGIGSIAAVPSLLEEALELAETTWPGAEVGGVKIGDEVPPGERANAYTLRVSVEFDADPGDPEAMSASVVCSPECQIIRHKVKRAPAAPFPCPLDEALAAAREAGVSGERPLVAYGYWNLDEHTGWTFREDEDAPVVAIGDGCRVENGAADPAP